MLKQRLSQDGEALYNLRNYVLHIKGTGKTRISLADITKRFSYPIDQIERVMDRLCDDGIVKEAKL
ncbi:hypothetical protein HYV82_01370 [Candidatus Woesearchaeota archaeon]|nr:hypothetical protein [Candidatus Woesearchaeota archaeon]